MTARSTTVQGVRIGFLAYVAAAAIGLTIIMFAGHAQTQVLHDAAHDVRHATGFPCH